MRIQLTEATPAPSVIFPACCLSSLRAGIGTFSALCSGPRVRGYGTVAKASSGPFPPPFWMTVGRFKRTQIQDTHSSPRKARVAVLAPQEGVSHTKERQKGSSMRPGLLIRQAGWDLLVPFLILGAVLRLHPLLPWLLYAYTVLLLLLRLLALAAGLRPSRPPEGERLPHALYHILYGLDVALLLWARWWIWAALWALIWALAALSERHR